MAAINKLSHVNSVHSSLRGTMDVIESWEQYTLIAGETIEEGAAVYIDATGKVLNADASANDAEAVVRGIAVRKVVAGEALTVLRRGIIGGYDLSAMAYFAPVFLNDTDGSLGTTAGTFSVTVGTVVPVHVGSPSPSSAPAKALRLFL
jgi:uncharacterized protein DUF2190